MFAQEAADPGLESSATPSPRWLRLGWRHRRRVAVLLLAVLAALPVLYVFAATADARRNVVYWDEFDTALAFALKLQEGTSVGGFLGELFSVSNEHRMVTSRLLFALLYWTTGTIDFSQLDLIGNGALVAACVVLVIAAGTGVRRLRLGLVLAFVLFQLEHHENFLWSGSSIDHFQIILLAAGSLLAVARGTTTGVLLGGALATLATFTLAHGLAVWPAGAVSLWRQGRRRELLLWGGLAAAAIAVFFLDYHLNPAQSFAHWSVAGAYQIVRYWLALLGASPALEWPAAAPLAGLALLGLLAYLARRGALRRERTLLPLALFAVIAAAMIAVGRAEFAAGHVHSRYHVLSGLAWALVVFMLVERHTHPRRPLRPLLAVLPGLLAFNLLANRAYADECASWLTCRDMAAVTFLQYGADGRGPFPLHPRPARSTALLRQAKAAGLYQLGPVCLPAEFPDDAAESTQISHYLEEVTVSATAATVRGWAGLPGRECVRGDLLLLLRAGPVTHAFSTVRVPRVDVARVTGEDGWLHAGFHFTKRLTRLPAGDFEIGLLLLGDEGAEYVMTGQRLRVPAH